MIGVEQLIPGERVLWQGRPNWRALARDVLHIRVVCLYIAVALVWRAASDRFDGAGSIETLRGCVPTLVLGGLVLGGVAVLAWACARTTTYTITTERCVLRYGIALEATLSIPWRRVAAVSVTSAADGTGDIPLALKPGSTLRTIKLWPHVRFWRVGRAQPMLRGVPDAVALAQLMSHAAAAVSAGRIEPNPGVAPDRKLEPAMAVGD